MKSNRFVSLILWTSFTVFVYSTSVAKADPTDQEMKSAKDTIVSVIRPYVSPLDRQMMTFHYSVETETPLVTSDAQVIDMVGGIADQFFNLDRVTTDMQGPGYYVAIDPHSTRSYGGDKPLLFVTPLRKGAMILNFDSNPHNDSNATAHDFEVLSTLTESLHCIPPTRANYRFFTLEMLTTVYRNSPSLACRKIITDAYRELGVDAIIYSYSADQFASNCRDRGGAFNIIRKEAIAPTGNALFWSSGTFGNPTTTKLIAQTYRDAHEEFSSRYMNFIDPRNLSVPTYFQNLGTFERSARSWRKRNLLSCGPMWGLERGKTESEMQTAILHAAYTDFEIQDAILDWHKAYRARVPNAEFDSTTFQRIHAVELQTFRNTGLTPDKFAGWIEATNLLADPRNDPDETDQKVSVLVGEKLPYGEVIDATGLPDHYSPMVRYSGMYPVALKYMGYGPILRSLKIAQLTGYLGGFPFLVGQPPTDQNDTSTDFFDANKAKLLSIIRPCTAMLNDRSISMETIQAGDCGVREFSLP